MEIITLRFIENIKYASIVDVIFHITSAKNSLQIYKRNINNETMTSLNIKKIDKLIVIPVEKVGYFVAFILPNCRVPVVKKREIFAKYDLYKCIR